MPNDPTLVNGEALDSLVRRIIADVLVISPDQVRDESAIVADLGAESIDFLDLVFRLEECLGKDIPIERWQRFLEERLPRGDYARTITTAIVTEFAAREARH